MAKPTNVVAKELCDAAFDTRPEAALAVRATIANAFEQLGPIGYTDVLLNQFLPEWKRRRAAAAAVERARELPRDNTDD